MWKRIVIIILLFYFFVLLQNSFLAHFNLFGAVINLAFVFFFSLVFFDKSLAGQSLGKNYQVVLLAAVAGFFLDVSTVRNSYFGISIILLAIIGLSIRFVRSLLSEHEDKYPFVYFLPIFAASFLIYYILNDFLFFIFETKKLIVPFGLPAVFSLGYNTIVACGFFYVLKRFFRRKPI